MKDKRSSNWGYIVRLVMVSVIVCLCASCGEDRTYEYEALTNRNHSMQAMLQDWYLWGENIKELEWKDYFGDVNACFDKFIKQAPVTDTWSYCSIDSLNKDYNERGLFNHLDSYGIDAVAMEDPTRLTNQTLARVITVYPNSPAEQCGLRRGDFIGYVDGAKVTTSNISNLRNGPARQLVVNHLAFIGDSLFWIAVDTMSMQASYKVEDTQVPVSRLYYRNGDYVAYMMVNHLNARNFISSLEALEHADIMVLDLRLCNDGTIENALALASCLVPKECYSSEFCHTVWNANHQDLCRTYNYDASLAPYNVGQRKLFVITGRYTRGASEWLINGLQATLGKDVVVVGTNTVGQNVLLKSVPSDYDYTLHPAVALVANANGDSSYGNGGITPDYVKDEYHYHPLNQYGNSDETLFNYILNNYETY